MEDEVEEFLNAGADKVLVKPLKTEQLDDIFDDAAQRAAECIAKNHN